MVFTTKLLSGNEAIALGAYEAGVKVGTGYPGTPSTQILEVLTTFQDVYTEWSVNEKVAFEVALGASLAGVRALVTMKHVGLNVAADPLFTSVYTGVKGGLVIVVADDPDMHSSQNEQDSRHYARAAKIPMLEPADSEEARLFTRLAFELSEQYDTPVLLRSTTRLSHGKSIVKVEDLKRPILPQPGFTRNIAKYVMVPSNARKRHQAVEERLLRLSLAIPSLPFNLIEKQPSQVGIITSGVCYQYVKEVFPEAAVLKLGLVWPLSLEQIRDFCNHYENLFCIEELDGFFETELKAFGFKVKGKELLPVTGEYSPSIIKERLAGYFQTKPVDHRSRQTQASLSELKLPPRPPALCPGCPHRTIFKILAELGLVVAGDIGCYTLGVMPPFSAMDTCVEMGGSIGLAQGIELAEGPEGQSKAVAVIGDSTFAHSGITGLINAAYNKRTSVIIVLDNNTTAMTGMQPNPFSGQRINGESTTAIDYRLLGQAVGLQDENIRLVDAARPEEVLTNLKELLATKRLSLLVVKGPCMIWKRKQKK